MFIGLIAKKVFMTRVFQDDGISLPVTVVSVEPNFVTQIKTKEKDGYSAIQVASLPQKQSRLNKPKIGHFLKARVSISSVLREFRVQDDHHKINLSDQLDLEGLADVTHVNVSSFSIGKGFQGGIKRHNFRGQDRSHGNSRSHRSIGSTGQCQDPGRVFPGKKMPGHMGNEKVSIRRIEIIKRKDNFLFLKGPLPGHKNSIILLKPSGQ